MTVGSLFAGIGGFDLGFERAGFDIKWQVEIDDYASRVLAKHWPHVRRYGDIRECGTRNLDPVDVICGGFPCQDISSAGQKFGIGGERSGLWSEMVRVVGELRPRYVVMENVSDLLFRGLGDVLGGLADIGYDAEWDRIPASALGAPHRRRRLWIVAYPKERMRDGVLFPSRIHVESVEAGYQRVWAMLSARRARRSAPADFRRLRADDGLSARLDDIAAIGNAIVPQIAEWIAHRIKEAEQQRTVIGSGTE